MTSAVIRCVSSLALLLVVAAPETRGEESGDSEPIRFRFAPPDRTEYLATSATIREDVLEGVSRRVDRIESVRAFSIEHYEGGYIMRSTPLSKTAFRDGKPLRDPVIELQESVILSYWIGHDGRIQRIDGFGGLVARIRRSFPASVAKQLVPRFEEQAMVERETTAWNGRIGDIAGGEFAIGHVIESEVSFTLPGRDPILCPARISFAGLQSCPAGTCVRVEHEYDSDAAALGKDESELDAKAKAREAREPRISGSLRRVYDPRTMLVYEEEWHRTTRMMRKAKDRGPVLATKMERQSITFDYR